jgi:small subunit ribosomal protein S6e
MGQEVEADTLGEEFKGYVFRINGGFDKDGFAMKQGIFCNNRIKLLLAPGTSGYRAKRKGERKRRSVRGCIVGPDIKTLSLTLIKKGEKEIPGLTDETKSRRLGPKRATGIRKLYGIEKTEGEKTTQSSCALIKKHAIRRTFKSAKKPDATRHKAPKVQRLVTEARLRRKRIQKEDKVKRWKKTIALTEEYKKVYDAFANKRRAENKERKASKVSAHGEKPAETKPAVTKPTKAAVTAPPAKAATTTKVATSTKPITAPKAAAPKVAAPAPATKVAAKEPKAKK